MIKSKSLKRYVLDNIDNGSLTEKENVELAKKVELNDTDAREKMIKCNMHIVRSLVDSFCKNDEQYTDILQSGFIGLMNAIDRYDWRKGSFGTYARRWINKYIRLSLYEINNLIAMPEELSRITIMINAIRNRMFSELGRNPTYDEMLRHHDMIKLINQGKLHKANVQTLLKINIYESLDANIDEEGNASYSDILEDQTRDISEDVISQDLIRELLRTLPDRDTIIVKLYLGLDDEAPMNFKQISERIGLTRQMCCVIYNKSINKLQKRFKEVMQITTGKNCNN